jgi:hypothetical protein
MMAEWERVAAGQARFGDWVWRWVNLIRWVESRGIKC